MTLRTLFLSRLQGKNHTYKDIPFDWKALVTRGIIVIQRNLFGNDLGRGACSTAPGKLSYEQSVDFIRNGLTASAPFMVGKVGTLDNETMLRFMDIHERENLLIKTIKLFTGNRRPFWWDNSIRAGISVCAGVFPATIEGIENFCRIYATYLPEMDGFASCADGESRIHDYYCPTAPAIEYGSLFPLWHGGYSWLQAPAGKRILVVHQYVKSLRTQCEKSMGKLELHKGQGVFPSFELILYKPVNSIGGKCKDFKCWNDALTHMINDISKIDFDIALVGCGVYGVPLSIHIKRMGKKVVHTGGATQLIFGIKSRHYDNGNIYNEHWIRPLPEDIPPNMILIENGRFL